MCFGVLGEVEGCNYDIEFGLEDGLVPKESEGVLVVACMVEYT